MNHNALINAAFKEIRQCCQHLLQGYDRLNSSAPSNADKSKFLDSIDGDIQHQLIRGLTKMYPKHMFVAEEPSNDVMHELPDHDDVWVIDPIDGSNNYMHHIPFFSISVCYYHKGNATAALVYDPLNDELFTAIRGRGAQLNQRRTHKSHVKDLSQVICSIEGKSGYHHNIEEKVRTTRRLGCTSLALCYVACGRLDLAIFEAPHLWDIAAGKLIAEESGVVCYNIDKSPYHMNDNELYASNEFIRDGL